MPPFFWNMNPVGNLDVGLAKIYELFVCGCAVSFHIYHYQSRQIPGPTMTLRR
jgi:hypothetical protein